VNTPVSFRTAPILQRGVDELDLFVAELLRAWAISCPEATRPSTADLERLAPLVAEALRLSGESVTVQELRLITAARGGWEQPT